MVTRPAFTATATRSSRRMVSMRLYSALIADDVLCLSTSLVTAKFSGLKTLGIFLSVLHNKTEDLGERCASQRDATVGGTVIEAELV